MKTLNLVLLVLQMILSFSRLSEQSVKLIKTGSSNASHYIELGIIVDNALYQKLDQEDDQVKQYSLDLVNEVNTFLHPINVSVHLVDVIIWKNQDEFPIPYNTIATLPNFQNFVRTMNATKTQPDIVILLSGIRNLKTISVAYQGNICKQPPSAAIILIKMGKSKQNVAAIVHEIGHILGATHDNECRCCVMSPSSTKWSDKGWSQESLQELVEKQELGLWTCLENKPSQIYVEVEDICD
uniref:Putative secreted metalloprotease n=1 Tax=Culex tarsalis TaxID=7177 RepID=A0A1Q3FME9_CULTA